MVDAGSALGMGGARHTPLAFQNAAELGDWLAKRHQSATELWVRIFKAGAGRPSVTWTDCVVEAIRFGWIDAQKKPLDAELSLTTPHPKEVEVRLVGQELLSCDDADRGRSDDSGRPGAG